MKGFHGEIRVDFKRVAIAAGFRYNKASAGDLWRLETTLNPIRHGWERDGQSSRHDAMDDHSTMPGTAHRPERLDLIRERFGVIWRAGGHPRIEDFLEGAEGCERARLLYELLVAELQLRVQGGEQPAADEYLGQFPADRSTVENALAALGLLHVTITASGPAAEHVRAGGEAAGEETQWYPGQTMKDTSAATPSSGTRRAPPAREPPVVADPGPQSIGRYRVLRCLGEGSAGRVYLAQDEDLNRTVAIKVPRLQAFQSSLKVDQFLDEARMAAQLRHPAIVAVHDVGRQPDGAVYIILEYVDGRTLSEVLKAGNLPLERLIGLLARVAEAVHYAHRRGLVHRDLKPANIIVDAEGNPHVADFGLALRDDVQRFHSGEIAGTATYMAPEQVRGEAHRLDGRTDVWAIGVILYRVLTGRRPFSGGRSELFDEILHREPKPPRQIRDTIARELERICLRCLSKRMADRHETALDLAKDLEHWLTGAKRSAEAADRGIRRAVPKGLRPFDGDDAESFLTLLPGPRDRDGLPESIRFWITRIEGRAGDAAFRVGLIYGPTGCGKSSLVRAGLLPQLCGRIRPVYVEASPDGTEARLLAVLRREFPDLPADFGPSGAAAFLRQRHATIPGTRVLIVLDQFEQWLHHHPTDRDSELLRALLQCDGTGLQALLLVRDDFWMAVTRFMHALEVPLNEGENSAAVELFDTAHARRVLSDFGRAYGQIPEQPDQPDPEAARFLDAAIRELAGPDGSIIPIRLILFAEMVRHRPWRLETLRALGGIQGIGVTFLEETFGERSAPLAHRIHRRAALGVLRALLPAPPSDLKGAHRSRGMLQEAAGYADRQRDFDELMRILDNELRMVTPVDAENLEAESTRQPDAAGQSCYQLTHDYLVPPLRLWLTRKQRETRAGRAQLRLAERTALWTNKPERKQLPNWWEWLRICLFTSRAEWTIPERRMMKAALRHQIWNAGFLSSILLFCIFSFYCIFKINNQKIIHNQVQEQVRQLWSIDLRYLPQHLDRLEENRGLWQDQVRAYLRQPAISSDLRTRGSLALARHEAAGVDYLAGRLLEGEPPEQRLLREELRRWKDRIVPGLWRELQDHSAASKRRLGAAAALAGYQAESPRWDSVAKPIVRDLTAQDPLLVSSWLEALHPVRNRLKPHLLECFEDPTIGEARQSLVASILADYASADGLYLDSGVLAELMLNANRAQFSIISPLAARRGAELADRLAVVLQEPVPLAPGPDRGRLVDRQANAAEALFHLGRGEQFWPLLRLSRDPQLRTQLIDRIGAANLSRVSLLERLAKEPDGSIRQAILLGLEGCDSTVEPAVRSSIADRLLSVYESDPDSGVHGAAEWVLSRWGFEGRVAKAKERLAGRPPGNKRWFITKHLHTMLVIPRPGKITVGSPPYEPNRDPSEHSREATIDYAFAISAHEVTFKQFQCFQSDSISRPDRECPMNFVSWYEAAQYCRWLSEQPEEAIPEERRCYPGLEQIGPSMRLPADYLRRDGYRLPTGNEWEFVARAGSATGWFIGSSALRLDEYAWLGRNSEEHTWPVGQKRPNPFGLFDICGNVAEWCDERDLKRDAKDCAIRGGDYRSTPRFLRSAMSPRLHPQSRLSVVGFRIVRTLAPADFEALDTGLANSLDPKPKSF